MKWTITVILTFLFLASCATSQQSTSTATYQGSSTLNSHHEPHAGQWAVAAVGTPFYLAFKTAVCGATLVIAAPAAAVASLSTSHYALGVDELGDDVAANCGPPYVLSPS